MTIGRLSIRIMLSVSVVGLLTVNASAGSISPIGYVVYNVTSPGTSAEFDIINQTGPNSSSDPTWPVITPVSLLNLSLTVDFSSGLPIVFGPSYFTQSPDGLSFDGSTIAIDGANPQPTHATLTGTFNPTAVTLFDTTTSILMPTFAATIFPSSGATLQDQDVALINGASSVPEPETTVLLAAGLLSMLMRRRALPVNAIAALIPPARARRLTILLFSILATFYSSPSASASVAIKLNSATSPSTGVAGTTNVNVTGSGFSSASITPANITVSLATSCGGAESASTPASSIKTVVGTSRAIQFLIPGALTQNTYFASISGTDSTGSGFASVNCSMIAVTTTAAITGCREITSPGSYSLATNLLQTDTTADCLAIHSVNNVPLNNVQLDCNSHTVTAANGAAISVTNVQNFSIRHCSLHNGGFTVLAVTAGSGGLLDGNTIGDLNQQYFEIHLQNVNNTILSNNTINAQVNQLYSAGNILRFNTATCPQWTNNKQCAALFSSHFGSNNTIDSNHIDGKSFAFSNGADDGILIGDESDDIVSNNVITNLWDAGIETVGNIVRLKIIGNSISNVTGFNNGIGGWIFSSWSNCQVMNNTVYGATLFHFYRQGGLRPQGYNEAGNSADTAVYFQDNLFLGNQLIGTLSGYASYIPTYNYLDYPVFGNPYPGVQDATIPTDFRLSNNTFTQNNFGHSQPPPFFGSGPVVPGIIVDGGGNICSPPAANYPLVCN